MSYRYMRIIVFFDLPTETILNRKSYRKFRKFLINEGFIMMQQSVYSKLALNNSVINSINLRIEKNKPNQGLVQILIVTENQFSNIYNLVGNNKTNRLDTTERMVII